MAHIVVDGRTFADKKAERKARAFKPDERLERLLEACERDHTLRDKLPPGLLMSLGFYQNAKVDFEAWQERTGDEG